MKFVWAFVCAFIVEAALATFVTDSQCALVYGLFVLRHLLLFFFHVPNIISIRECKTQREYCMRKRMSPGPVFLCVRV